MLEQKGRFSSIRGAVFWVLFALFGAFFLFRIPFKEVLVGLMVIFLGVHKLGSEIEGRRLQRERVAIQETLGEIHTLLEREFEHLKKMEARYENRFFRMDSKLIASGKRTAEAGKVLEKSHRDVVRKIVELENKMNKVSRAFLTPSSRSGRGK